MNDPIDPLENELRSFRPVAAPPHLAAAISTALATPAVAPVRMSPLVRFSLGLSWSVTAIAATIAVVVLLRDRPARETPTGVVELRPLVSQAPEFSGPPAGTVNADEVFRVRPVTTAEYLLGTRDEGIVELAGGTRARRVRLQYLDNIELRAESGPATVTVSYPREEIRHIPIQAF